MESMQALLNFHEVLDIQLLETTIARSKSSSHEERRFAFDILESFKSHPQAISRVGNILQLSNDLDTKYYALQVLEDVVTTRWKTFPREHCITIRKQVVELIGECISLILADNERAKLEHVYLTKLNAILVLILEREWPKYWPNFISEIVGVSIVHETIWQNTMRIFTKLSEEVFEFSKYKMTRIKARHLKLAMYSKEFKQVLGACNYFMAKSKNSSIVAATLETLLRFINWIDFSDIFEAPIISILVEHLNDPQYRTTSLKCLTAIAELSPGDMYDDKFVEIFSKTMLHLQRILPQDMVIKMAIEDGDIQLDLIQDVATFLCTILKKHGPLLATRTDGNFLTAFMYLLFISEVEDKEIFKTCLEYWRALVLDLHREKRTAVAAGGAASSVRYESYQSVLIRLREIIITKMEKPKDVLVFKNESGRVVREFMRETETTYVYKLMQSTLVHLTHLDTTETKEIILKKMKAEVNGSSLSWKNVNTLCWAVGAISGTMAVEEETPFIVAVIEDLFALSKKTEPVEDKAVIASNIMYILGQYPRVLKSDCFLLRDVVTKLFDFMQEPDAEVKDMACDIFIKIARDCKNQLIKVQDSEGHSFIAEILLLLDPITSGLLPRHLPIFYEAIGCIISAERDILVRERLIESYMCIPNKLLGDIIGQARSNVYVLHNLSSISILGNILEVNVKACKSLKRFYVSQLQKIFSDALFVFKAMSENISGALAVRGEMGKKQPLLEGMGLVKTGTLNLICEWISVSNDSDIPDTFIDLVVGAILLDYRNCPIPSARDPESLLTIAAMVNKFQARMIPHVPKIFDAVFHCTLDMIKTQDLPDNRASFYLMLKAVNIYCYPAFLSFSPANNNIVLESIIWACKHTMRDVADTGLDILLQLLKNVSQAGSAAQDFHQTYYMDILHILISVVISKTHTTGLKMHATILAYMFSLVENGEVAVCLNPDVQIITTPQTVNVMYVKNRVTSFLSESFPHLLTQQLTVIVEGFFNLNHNVKALKNHLRDFLVQITELSGDDASDLFLDEREEELMTAQEMKGAAHNSAVTDNDSDAEMIG